MSPPSHPSTSSILTGHLEELDPGQRGCQVQTACYTRFAMREGYRYSTVLGDPSTVLGHCFRPATARWEVPSARELTTAARYLLASSAHRGQRAGRSADTDSYTTDTAYHSWSGSSLHRTGGGWHTDPGGTWCMYLGKSLGVSLLRRLVDAQLGRDGTC
ncbi:uncharacterized protein LY79DRAFT_244200 [Colletotrichum navitas]|uniref:Uncharacterized protein n=1 Tax=Colletotrichum navitas TaxID=681940 RepID=A0AAD8PXJ6_9PEZI|nr:uncharacterized protein LY79DRAFT_244200 [Colletotrichum navitas]KAK1586003.1 hypothetical protein LY79DRAFT_244200 [Colletotrichum navitas]